MEYYYCLGMVQIRALTNANFVVEDVHQGKGRSFAALRMTGGAMDERGARWMRGRNYGFL
jgi:hypothetical protein